MHLRIFVVPLGWCCTRKELLESFQMQRYDHGDILTVSSTVLTLSLVFHRTYCWTGETRAFLGYNLPWQGFSLRILLAVPNSSSFANPNLDENAVARHDSRSRAQQLSLQQGQEWLDDTFRGAQVLCLLSIKLSLTKKWQTKSVTAGAGMHMLMRHDAAMALRLIASAIREPDAVTTLSIAVFGALCWYYV